MKHRRRRGAGVAALAVAAVGLVVASTGGARAVAGPTQAAEPSISGAAVVGSTLQGNRGLWSSSKGISYKYQWLRCKADAGDDSSSKSCTGVSGATKEKYGVISADLGFRLRFRVTASNSTGTSQATSPATSVVTTEGGKPASASPPTISGTPLVGSTLVGSPGTWVGDKPITFSYKWTRCDKDGNACKAIGGATAVTYKVQQADVGRTLRLYVKAKNSRGTGDAISTNTSVVDDASGGIIELPNGEKSVDVKDVPRDQRLVIQQVTFNPSPVTSRTVPIQVRIKIEDTRGYVVRGALVFIRSTPNLTQAAPEIPTAVDGWVTFYIVPRADFPLKTGYNVQFFIRASRKGDPGLAGVGTRRLVQVATRTP